MFLVVVSSVLAVLRAKIVAMIERKASKVPTRPKVIAIVSLASNDSCQRGVEG
jgi:hypothetical protein